MKGLDRQARKLAPLCLAAFGAACGVHRAPVGAGGAARPPNIVFILVDDLGAMDVGFMGSTAYETPEVDRLARQGMVFRAAYSAGPVCSPTRCSILTGLNPARVGITTFLLEPRRDPAHVTSQLPSETTTLAEILEAHGYATGYFGKWHLGYRREDWADHHGFDVAIGGMDLPWAWKLAHPGKPRPPLNRRRGHTRFFSPHHLTFMENGPAGEYLTDRLTDETIRFLEAQRDRPFLAFLSYHTVHTPLQAKPDVVAQCRSRIEGLGLAKLAEPDPKEKRHQNNPRYAAMVRHMDENVGRVLRALARLGLRERTIVVWTSDNGGKGSVTSNRPLRGMKHNLYEGGIRVPLIVRWPGKVRAGASSALPVLSDDFVPTLLELAGLDGGGPFDGRSFAAAALGQPEGSPPRQLFWHYPHGRQEGAVRDGNWKLLLRYADRRRCELYDLSRDPGESRDLAPAHPGRVERMRAAHREWRARVGAKMPARLVR